MEGASTLRSREEAYRASVMKEFSKMAVCALVVLILAPMIGFWVVAAVGASMGLLPLGAAFSKAFPMAWSRITDGVFTTTTSAST